MLVSPSLQSRIDVAAPSLVCVDVELHVALGAERAGDDRALRMLLRLLAA